MVKYRRNRPMAGYGGMPFKSTESTSQYPMTIQILSAIAAPHPRENEDKSLYAADVATKGYVDEAVGRAPSSTESAPTALSDSTGTYTAACPVLDSDTYLIKQEALAPEYYASTAYNIGDVCTYHGKLWTRTAYDGQTGLAPEGMAVQGWEETSLVNLIPSDISMQRRPIRQMTSVQIDMSDDATVFILPSQSNPVISLLHTATVTGSQGSFSQSYWGTNLVEFQLFIPMTVQATALKWNAQNVIWLQGSASDLVADKTHIVRMRLIPQLSMGTPGQILAEYVGGYVPTG